jgi:hypothetical protein
MQTETFDDCQQGLDAILIRQVFDQLGTGKPLAAENQIFKANAIEQFFSSCSAGADQLYQPAVSVGVYVSAKSGGTGMLL